MTVAIAVLNRKGGVGKTTLTKDLSHALVADGRRVLVIGLDPQASLEVVAGLGFDTPPRQTVSRLLLPEEFPADEPLDAVVHATPWAAALVPASKALARAERALGEPGRGGANQRLRRGLERLGVDELYEVVLIDCPPGMTPLTMNALVAASHVLVPTPLDFLWVAGLAVLLETVEEVRDYDNPRLRYLGIVGTQVDERTRHAREVRAQLEQLFGANAGGVLCRSQIRHTTRVRDANAARLAVGQFDPSTPSAATTESSRTSSPSAPDSTRRWKWFDDPRQASARRRRRQRPVRPAQRDRRPRRPRPPQRRAAAFTAVRRPPA